MESKISGKLLNLQTQRTIAKVGMGISLGLVTLTAFNMKNRFSKGLHVAAGVSLVAFSFYHYGLYNDCIFQTMLTKKRTKLPLKKATK
ncbi:helicase [Campylobacter sp. faydin G-24]|uniref:Helicase n=1 Tax=Campylobacter anatolicus TaxID=2829105 RepID=A0ABS5HHD1_9BACT|nr:helicase [Campylobacter anatolicus]MBR8462195.1 helicase [Campylobacter anatolicus]MBR8463688.1 helicase [Campylobacter anatolicus]